MEELNINRLKLLLLAFFIFTLSSFIGAAATYTVATDGTGNYATIQAAVNSANAGDTILVHPGTYNENIEITRTTGFALMSASGNPDDTIIVSSNANKSVISAVTRSNLVIRGFTIAGAATDSSGIYLETCRDCRIENNKFLNDAMGVYVKNSLNTTVQSNIAAKTINPGTGRGVNIERSDLTTVSGNTISDQRFGIYFMGSKRNTISGNSISQSADDSIVVDTTNITTIEKNIVKSNGRYGIFLNNSDTDTLNSNTVSNGLNGIYLLRSPKNTVSSNSVDFGNQHDIMLDNSSDNSLTGNTVSSSPYGIAVRYSNNNILTGNNAYNNTLGLYVTLTSTKNTLSDNTANSNRGSGIGLYRVNDNILQHNEVNSNTNQGIIVDSSSNNRVFNNSVSKNARGIYVSSLSSGNVFSGNIVNSNTGNSGFSGDGIRVENSSGNDFISNAMNSNNAYGIYLANSNYTDVVKNTAQNNKRGISLLASANNTISENLATDSLESGLFLSLCTNNTISKSLISNNKEGISLDSSENNVILDNNVSSNGNGIYMCPRSYGNRVYNNCFNNINNANIRNSRCTWNIEKTQGKNIMGGKNLGGNFWGNPAGLGFSDTYPDNDGDDIIDTAFVSANGNITDNYPLIRVVLPAANFDVRPTKGFVPLSVSFTDYSERASSINWDVNGDGKTDYTNSTFVHVYEKPGTYYATLTAINKNGTDIKPVTIIAEEFKVYPVADFSVNPMSGDAPLSVQFTDLSQNATSRNWDIGSDGTIESTNASFAYVFSVPGNYPVSLTATNPNGTASKAATITVTQQSSSGGGSSGGSHKSGGSSGGGGGGGSPESAKNIQVKEISQTHVASGKPVKFDFAKNATCVVYVSFDAKKTAGKTTTIAEQLKGKSAQVSNLSTGEVYKYFNLWVGNAGFATEKNIENPVVCFKVEKSWLQDKKIDKNSITLNRYSDKKWSELPVKLLREDNKYLYLTAETPGFTYFAITGKAAEKPTADTKPATDTSELEENNTTVTETEQEQNPTQETGKGKISSIPGFEGLCVVACLITLFLHKKK